MQTLVDPFISFTPPGPAPDTFYVATDGDDANPGTETEPWATITYGATQLTAGNTLVVASGTYHESGITVTADGTSSDRITITGVGTPIIDGSLSDFRTVGNSAWEVFDAGRHIYRTPISYPDPGGFGYTGHIDGNSGELLLLTAYDDLAHLSADDDLFDFANPYYMGPGITHHTDSRIYIRLDPNSAEAQWNNVSFPPYVFSDLDPRNHTIFISPNNGGFNIGGDYVTIDGFECRHHWTTFGGLGAHVNVENVTMIPNRFGARLDADAWTFDTCTIDMKNASWRARSDIKSGVEPGKDTRTGGISFESSHGHTVNACTIIGAFDSLLMLGNNHGITITNCLLDKSQDDGCQMGSAAYDIEYGHNTWLGAGVSHDGSGSDAVNTPDTVYLHHNVFDNTNLIFWSRKPVPGNDPADNSTVGYEHPPLVGSHGVPDFDDPWKIYNNTFVAYYAPGLVGTNHYMYHGDSPGLGIHEAYNNIINMPGSEMRVYRHANANSGLENFDYNLYRRGDNLEAFAIESTRANGTTASVTTAFSTWQTDMAWDAHSSHSNTMVPLDGSYRPAIGGPADGTGVNLSAKGWPGTSPGTTYIGAKEPV